MKKSFIVLFCLCAMAFTANSQTTNDYLEMSREVMQLEAKAAIADVMQLTETESQPFWDLYNEYMTEVYKINNEVIAVIKDYAANYETMNDEKADELWLKTIENKEAILKLKKSYYSKFKKILPAAKAVKFFQAENKIEALINAELSLEIPMIETK